MRNRSHRSILPGRRLIFVTYNGLRLDVHDYSLSFRVASTRQQHDAVLFAQPSYIIERRIAHLHRGTSPRTTDKRNCSILSPTIYFRFSVSVVGTACLSIAILPIDRRHIDYGTRDVCTNVALATFTCETASVVNLKKNVYHVYHAGDPMCNPLLIRA